MIDFYFLYFTPDSKSWFNVWGGNDYIFKFLVYFSLGFPDIVEVHTFDKQTYRTEEGVLTFSP